MTGAFFSDAACQKKQKKKPLTHRHADPSLSAQLYTLAQRTCDPRAITPIIFLHALTASPPGTCIFLPQLPFLYHCYLLINLELYQHLFSTCYITFLYAPAPNINPPMPTFLSDPPKHRTSQLRYMACTGHFRSVDLSERRPFLRYCYSICFQSRQASSTRKCAVGWDLRRRFPALCSRSRT